MPRYIEQLNECTDPASGDWLWLVDSSAGATDKDRRVNAGLVPWTNVANTFTKTVMVEDPASTAAITVKARTNGLQSILLWTVSGVTRGAISCSPADSSIGLNAFDNGEGNGTYLSLQRNSNASTPAAGFLMMQNRSGSSYRVWVDASGLLRTGVIYPTFANDSAGTVVGSQTSSLDSKELLGPAVDGAEALLFVAEGAEAVRRFTYKSGAFGGEEFSGLVVDYAPRYGMDRDDEHPAGKSLNVVTAVGDLMLAVAHLAERVAALEGAGG